MDVVRVPLSDDGYELETYQPVLFRPQWPDKVLYSPNPDPDAIALILRRVGYRPEHIDLALALLLTGTDWLEVEYLIGDHPRSWAYAMVEDDIDLPDEWRR